VEPGLEFDLERILRFGLLPQVHAESDFSIDILDAYVVGTAVARPTVQGYFSALVDTLVGFWLPAWRKRVKDGPIRVLVLRKFPADLASGSVLTAGGSGSENDTDSEEVPPETSL
jgi:hypothetical protein